MSGSHDGAVLVRVERRRRWSDDEKLAILKETTEPGAIIAAVARRHRIGTGQLYTWRRQLLRQRRLPSALTNILDRRLEKKARLAGRASQFTMYENQNL
ncbi:transposase [Novosphingobium sp.]|uniref:transposase n=1 Tax=Novosphingobium sp. TaxID=1874826 RepID=UPI003562D20C